MRSSDAGVAAAQLERVDLEGQLFVGHPSRSRISSGQVPPGARQGRNDFGNVGYDGPRPPAGRGRHRYRFRLYAIHVEIPLANGATIADLHAALDGVTLRRAELVGIHTR
jgi:Raf kinase inhibitor-like YbhB/YbcL family protein